MTKRVFALAVAILAGTAPVRSQEATTYSYDGSFEDATFSVETAIVNKGLVVDWVSHVGEMLNRTREDVGGGETIFDAADVFLFCSAVVSRSVMEADPMNIQHCPYGIFVTDKDGEVTIGYSRYPEGAMQEVQALLDEIAREAVEN
ncbi:DUF302 domain-containing protein [Sulfitobacter sp. D35]|uniref:DUF302 domain-containing protein n=1 Tax=Sulfitobacter sp. D35 TaxID=3083252 RepID=UPI00296E8EB7|nr:DUF302 domain-containing protein [Sulfitobacter sp. D35]MDW4498746.1 DUF302 domain-containing protein [Sulfitobacter sp. D35]